eukprot:10313001-Alexandrium_andersonii.AAC.1
MSASLVGSEMCIRDRPWTTRGCVSPSVTSAAHPQAATAVCGCTRPCMQAVSYTHLTLPTICSV